MKDDRFPGYADQKYYCMVRRYPVYILSYKTTRALRNAFPVWLRFWPAPLLWGFSIMAHKGRLLASLAGLLMYAPYFALLPILISVLVGHLTVVVGWR